MMEGTITVQSVPKKFNTPPLNVKKMLFPRVSLFIVVSWFYCGFASTVQNNTVCGLECWLQGLVINVPFAEKTELFGVSNIVCDRIAVPRLQSSYDGYEGLEFGISFNLSCTLDWEVGCGCVDCLFVLSSRLFFFWR